MKRLLRFMLLGLLTGGCQSVRFAPTFDPSTLQVGDMLFYAPEKFDDDPLGALAGGGIAAATHRLKSHVEVVYCITNGQVMTLGARYPKVDVYPVRIDACLACVRRMPNSRDFNKTAADLAVQEDIGQRYDVPGLLSFLLQPFIIKKDILVCSTLTAKYLRAGGTDPVNPYVATSTVTPGDLFVSGLPVTIWRNAEIDRMKR